MRVSYRQKLQFTYVKYYKLYQARKKNKIFKFVFALFSMGEEVQFSRQKKGNAHYKFCSACYVTSSARLIKHLQLLFGLTFILSLFEYLQIYRNLPVN